jgi:hypothetical protein
MNYHIIDRTFIEKIDHELIEQDIPLYARPLRVAVAWMKEKRIYCDICAPELMEPLMKTYKQIYPTGDFSMPNLLVGGVGFRDRMYFARVYVAFGTIAFTPLECIDIPPSELEVICKKDLHQVQRAIYSVADLWDFAYGVNDLRQQNSDADRLWTNARSALVSTARILKDGHDVDSSVQSACLTAELAMKGVLTFLGWTEPRLRKLGHNLQDIAEAVISCRSLASDDRLKRACAAFPDYVKSRYNSHGLTRVQLIDLGMRSQFVAAEALRRVSERKIAIEIEEDQMTPPREDI